MTDKETAKFLISKVCQRGTVYLERHSEDALTFGGMDRALRFDDEESALAVTEAMQVNFKATGLSVVPERG